jgi:3-deoxy-manno-octulosonate cytidylyltransferase (CMP-KDO synthetase)
MNFDDVLVVIPARYKSTRLPGKPLVEIAGKPMILRTAERVLEVVPRDRMLVATDDQRIVDVCEAEGIPVALTADDHPTGTDRVAEIARRFPAKLYINVQGDEPVFPSEDILRIMEAVENDPDRTYIGYCEMSEEQWRDSKNIKLLFGLDNQLTYIGRAQVPGSHDGAFRVGYRQVCIYAFPPEALRAFSEVDGRTPIEAIEDCEPVRFLELGLPISVVKLSADSISVDRPDDVAKVEAFLAART